MTLTVGKYALTTLTGSVPLICSMKKYTRSKKAPGPKDPGMIVLLGHGSGFPKEIWEPVIEDLFNFDNESADFKYPRIREAWALDCQNHGESCTLNEDILSKNPEVITIWDYTEAFANLIKSGMLGPIDPELHKIVLCGHSAGSVAVTISTSFFNPPYLLQSKYNISALILIDTPICAHSKDRDSEMYKMVEAKTPIRKDKWASRDATVEWMKGKPPFFAWEKRVFEIYSKYAFRSLPTAFYPTQTLPLPTPTISSPTETPVTLTTHRLGENMAFTGIKYKWDALNRLNQICAYVPVHLIYGEVCDMFDRDMQDSIVDTSEGRRIIASETRIKGAGHLVPLEKPTEVAKAIMDILNGKVKPLVDDTSSKL